MPDPRLTPPQLRRIRLGILIVLLGLFLFVLGVYPDLFGLDRSPVVGFVQIGVWLFGLALLLLGAYATVRVVRAGRPNSLRADVGLRLIATGYVFAFAASLADFIGIGSHQMPQIYFGPVQVLGLAAGVSISLVGVILYWPHPRPEGEEEPVR